MIRTNEDGFKIFDNGEWGQFLVIETRRLDDCLNYLKRSGLTRIHLNKHHGYKANDLGVLASLDFVDGLTAPIDLDFSQLRRLRKLKILGLRDNGKDVVDLSWFPQLECCAVTWSERLRGLSQCKRLRDLTLTDYASQTKDLREFPNLTALEKLTLIRSTIESFSGIGKLPVLRHLEASLMYKLVSVAGLKERKDTLELVILENCRKLEDHAELGQLAHLRKLLLLDCGQMQSLRFISRLRSLEFLSFGRTRVLDGDISPCLKHKNLNYVGFDNKRNYSHRFEDVKRVIEERKKAQN